MEVYTKNGWIFAIQQLAQAIPDPVAIAEVEPIADPATADAEEIATKLNELIAALQSA